VTRPRIGALRRRLIIEAATRTETDAGGAFETWNEVATIWAELAPQVGDESFRAETIAARVTHRIHIRYRDDLTPAHRFRLGTRIFEIVAIIDVDERRRFLRCQCEERDL
jgi:SPP1 family predicted phage head-tail adaptor